MRRLSWIVGVGPKCHYIFPCKGEAQEPYTHTHKPDADVKMEPKVGVCSHKPRMVATMRSWKRRETGSLLESLERVQPSQHLGFCLVIPM